MTRYHNHCLACLEGEEHRKHDDLLLGEDPYDERDQDDTDAASSIDLEGAFDADDTAWRVLVDEERNIVLTAEERGEAR